MKYLVSLLFILLVSSEVKAQESLATGFLKLEFNADSALIVVDYDFTKTTFIANGTILELEAGLRTIELNLPLRPKITEQIFVFENRSRTLRIVFSDDSLSIESVKGNYASKEYFGLNTFVMTDEDSEIYYEGELLGKGFAAIDLPEGSGWIEIENPVFGKESVRVNGLPFLEVYEHYKRPNRQLSNALSVVPGVSQFYKKDLIKSALFAGTFYPVFTIWIDTHLKYNSGLDDLDQLIKLYGNAGLERDANALGDQIDLKFQELDDLEKKRARFALYTGLIYGINIVDAVFMRPKGGFREKKNLDFYLDSDELPEGYYPNLTMKVKF